MLFSCAQGHTPLPLGPGPTELCWKVSPFFHQEGSFCTLSVSQQSRKMHTFSPRPRNPLFPYFRSKKYKALNSPSTAPFTMNLGLKCLLGQLPTCILYLVLLSLQTLFLQSHRTLHKMPGIHEGNEHPTYH